jgi:hypothetical protein
MVILKKSVNIHSLFHNAYMCNVILFYCRSDAVEKTLERPLCIANSPLTVKKFAHFNRTSKYYYFYYYYYYYHHHHQSGFGGLEDACWPLVPKFAGSNPAEAVGFFRAKKSPARLPLEGK